MKMFDENGHLSSAGLQALLQGQPDELQRLEAAEHLAFCDECLLRYTALLEEDALLSPQKDLAPMVQKRLRRHNLRALGNRYMTAAAAAFLAVALWAALTLSAPGTWPQTLAAGGTFSLGAWMNEKTFVLGNALDNFWGLLFPSQPADESTEDDTDPLPPDEERPVLPT